MELGEFPSVESPSNRIAEGKWMEFSIMQNKNGFWPPKLTNDWDTRGIWTQALTWFILSFRPLTLEYVLMLLMDESAWNASRWTHSINNRSGKKVRPSKAYNEVSITKTGGSISKWPRVTSFWDCLQYVSCENQVKIGAFGGFGGTCIQEADCTDVSK